MPKIKTIFVLILNFFRRQMSWFKSRLKEEYATKLRNSHSQYGEDLILDRLMQKKAKGFFIDIGANDPNKFNNTLRFYKRGWNGINIEPIKQLFDRIDTNRKRDINLNVGIGAVEETIPFYQISPDTLSTFDKEIAEIAICQGFKLDKTIEVPILRLETIFETYCKERIVDFISIDVEGLEVEVLTSNNWGLYRSNLVMIEVNRAKNEIEKFMTEIGYKGIFSNGTNTIYQDTKNQ